MQTLLIIGYVWPEPTATAAGSRMLQIIHQFQQSNYQVVFASPAQKPETAFALETIDVKSVSIVLNDVSFDVFLKEISPSIVLFDRFMMEEQFGWRVVKECPKAIRILDSEDLHFLRKARQLAVKNGEELPTGKLHTDDAKREIASIYRCDVTLTISEFEMDYLQRVYAIPAYLLWYFPFIIKVEEKETSSFTERTHFMFIGNFIHDPNWDAVLELKKYIWPSLRKQVPTAKLYIYGGYPSEKVWQLHNPAERFYVMGRAKEVVTVMQSARVCLAPLRFGAGLKGKMMDAMQNQTPFVTSSVGAEGMFGMHDFSDVIASTREEFVQKSVTLYCNQQLWETMANQGTNVLKDRFNEIAYRTVFVTKLQALLENYEQYRTQNFIGAMLQHHTLKSSMYLSKWIEEKNKS